MTDISLTTIAVPIAVDLTPSRESIENARSRLAEASEALIWGAYGLPLAAFKKSPASASIAHFSRAAMLADQQTTEALMPIFHLTGLPIAFIKDELRRRYPGTLDQFIVEIMMGGKLYRRLCRLSEILEDNPIEIEEIEMRITPGEFDIEIEAQ